MKDGRVRPEMILYTLNGDWLGVNQEFKPSFEGNLDWKKGAKVKNKVYKGNLQLKCKKNGTKSI